MSREMPEPAEGIHQVVTQFLAANTTYAVLFVTVLAVDPFRSFLLRHWVYVVFGFVALEAITGLAIWMMRREHNSATQIFPDDTIDEYALRFAAPADYSALLLVYSDWFPHQLSVDNAEYRHLLCRGSFVRLMEFVYSSGRSEVVGYYGVWPISRQTFEALVEGTLKEKDFTSKDVLDWADPAAQVLYTSEICRFKSHPDAGQALLSDMMDYVQTMLQKHENLAHIGAWAYSKIGLSLCKRFLMAQRSRSNGKTTEFYEADRERISKLWRPRHKFVVTRHIRL